MLKPNSLVSETATKPDRDVVKADLCILGAGPGGVALAASAASCGQSVVLVEKHRLGGTSLNYGTVPSMALAAAAETAATFRYAGAFGIKPVEPHVDWAALALRSRDAVVGLAPNVSAERLAGLGVKIIQANGRFADRRTVIAGEHRIEARRFVIATGSIPITPTIAGIDTIPVFTTESIFDNREPIEHLIVIGAGAAGTQLAQAMRRLGARVSLFDRASMLARFDPELSDVVRTRLQAEGVSIYEKANVVRINGAPRRLTVEGTIDGKPFHVDGTHVLIACGRRPAIAESGLELAKVAVGTEGVTVDRRLRTSNPLIYAIGDVTGHPCSVQKTEHQARSLVASLVVGRPLPGDPRCVPIALYTDPEIALVGLDETEARRRHGRIEVQRFAMRENLRALVLRAPVGHIKVITDRRGRILGAGIVGRAAAELIQVWSLAISQHLTLTDMAGWIAPHPTLGEISRKVAVHRYAETAGHAARRAWGGLLARLQ